MNPSRLLVVEDEAIVAMDIEKRLVSIGYQLAGSVASGEQALAFVEQQRPDLVLMDIRLQGAMDGITAADEIRRKYHLPVIFLTAYSEDATLERASRAEPYGYILKPFDNRDLKTAVETALVKHGADREIYNLNRLYAVLSQTNQAAVRIASREELLQTVCRVVVERGAADLAWIGWLDPATMRIKPVAGFGNRSEALNEMEVFADGRSEGQGNPGRAIRDGRPSICNACSMDDCLCFSAFDPARFGSRSCGSFPIRFQGEVSGVLNVAIAETGFFQERQIELLEQVAQDVSFALAKIEAEFLRTQAQARVVRQNAVLEGVSRILTEALRDRAGENLAEVCLATVQKITESQFGFIAELGSEGRLDATAVSNPRMETGGPAGGSPHPSPLLCMKDREVLGRLVNSGKGFFTNDPASEPDRIEFPTGHPPVEAFLAVPLRREGRTIGMIGLGNRVGGYNQEQLESVETLASVIVEAFSRKRAEEEARDQRETLEKVFECSPYIMMLVDRDGRVTKINRVCAAFSGRPEEEVQGLLAGEVFNCLNAFGGLRCGRNCDCSDCPVGTRVIHTFRTGEATRDAEGRLMVRKGSADVAVDMLISTALVNRADSDSVLVTIADITERKGVERRLHESEERFRQLAENIRDVFWVRTPDEILYISPAFEDVWGMSRESLYRDPGSFPTLVHPEDRERVLRAHQADLEGVAHLDEEYRIVRADGAVRWIWVRSFPVYEHGTLVRTVGIGEDITARKQVDDFLRIERDLALRLGSTATLGEALGSLLEACLEIDDLDCGGIYLLERETEELKLVCHQGLSEAFLKRVSLFPLSSPQGRFAMQGKPGYWSEPVRIFEMASLFKTEGLKALASIPVKSEGAVVALLNVGSHTHAEISSTIRASIESIASHIGEIISRVRLGETIKAQSERLEESNAALRALLRQREQDRADLEESFVSNVKHLILPYLEKLKSSRLTDEQKTFLEILEYHVREITSPFVRRVSASLLGLTPTEIRVAELIRQGKTSKEIADLLLISESAVIFHRQGIRRKLGLVGKSINLQAYLGTLV